MFAMRTSRTRGPPPHQNLQMELIGLRRPTALTVMDEGGGAFLTLVVGLGLLVHHGGRSRELEEKDVTRQCLNGPVN